MRTLLAALLLLVTAFAAAPAAAQSPEGTWALARINGTALPTPSPSEQTVVIDGLTVALGADSAYTLSIRARHAPTDAPVTMEVAGTWRVQGDRLHLTPREDGEAAPVDFRWVMREGEMVWWDRENIELAFTRQ